MDSCIFCSLPDYRVVAENDLTITVRDGYPVSDGHSLIIPKRHIASYFEASDEELMAINQALKLQKLEIDSEFEPSGYNIGVNSGQVAGQTVMHLHVHLIPRYAGDIDDPRGGVRWVLPEHANYWSK